MAEQTCNPETPKALRREYAVRFCMCDSLSKLVVVGDKKSIIALKVVW